MWSGFCCFFGAWNTITHNWAVCLQPYSIIWVHHQEVFLVSRVSQPFSNGTGDHTDIQGQSYIKSNVLKHWLEYQPPSQVTQHSNSYSYLYYILTFLFSLSHGPTHARTPAWRNLGLLMCEKAPPPSPLFCILSWRGLTSVPLLPLFKVDPCVGQTPVI